MNKNRMAHNKLLRKLLAHAELLKIPKGLATKLVRYAWNKAVDTYMDDEGEPDLEKLALGYFSAMWGKLLIGSDPEAISGYYSVAKRVAWQRLKLEPVDDSVQEDIVQEALFKILMAAKNKGEIPEITRRYIAITINHAYLDLQKRQPTCEIRVDDLPERYAADMKLNDKCESVDYEARALAQLNQDQRQVFVLKVHYGMTLKEIGELLDVPRNTVASRWDRAKRQLRKICEEYNTHNIDANSKGAFFNGN